MGTVPTPRHPLPPRHPLLIVVLAAALLLPAPTAQAGVVRGIMSIVAGVLEVPRSTIAGTFGGPPIVGTLLGVVNGTFRGVALITHGVLETVVSSVGLAKKYAPLIPIFL